MISTFRTSDFQISGSAISSHKNIHLQFIEYSENRKLDIPAICLQDVIECAIDFCGKQKSEEELYNNLIKLKYIIVIEFCDKGLSYRLARNGDMDETIRINYLSKKALEEREKCLRWLHKSERHTQRELESDESIIRFNREIVMLLEATMHQKDVYLSDNIRQRVSRLFNEMRGEIRFKNNNKDIIKLITLLLLNLSDKMVTDKSELHASFALILETVFLRYFCVGLEQEVKITYKELFDKV